jgi:photosystem II stability/assembly factor-like uncharacterized protein
MAKKSLLVALIVLSSICLLSVSLPASEWYWQNPLPQGSPLRGVSFTDPNTGTAVGHSGSIIRTEDGGATWVHQTSGTTNHLLEVFFTDANTGTAVGNGGTILRTTDGGATWVSQASGTYEELAGVWFTDANTGTVVGLYGTILRTTDGGATWGSQTSGTSDDLSGVCFTDANTGTAVGNGGTILRTMDGGAAWARQTSGTNSDLLGVSFTDEYAGTVVGLYGTILRTTDGGATWVSEASGTSEWLSGVSFFDANRGVAVGWCGTIIRRIEDEPVAVLIENFASAWAGDHAEITWSLSGAALESNLTFDVSRSADRGAGFMKLPEPDIRRDGASFVLSDRATEPSTRYTYHVVIYENGRAAASFDTELETPAVAFSLSQNYPNPFNPSTSIEVTMAEGGRAALEIYDARGTLVRTLLDGRLLAGTNTVKWDGCNAAGTKVASGMYFYRFTAGTSSVSRKMVLLR